MSIKTKNVITAKNKQKKKSFCPLLKHLGFNGMSQQGGNDVLNVFFPSENVLKFSRIDVTKQSCTCINRDKDNFF